jgi:hypothetical protein
MPSCGGEAGRRIEEGDALLSSLVENCRRGFVLHHNREERVGGWGFAEREKRERDGKKTDRW